MLLSPSLFPKWAACSCSFLLPKKSSTTLLHVPSSMPFLLFPFPKKNLTKPQLHVPSLGIREKGEGEGTLNSRNHGKKGSLGPARNNSRGRRAKNRDLREEPYHQDLLKDCLKTWGKTNILLLAGCYPIFQTKGKWKKTRKWKRWCSCTLTQGILTKWTDLCRIKDEWTHAQTLTQDTWMILNA